MKNTCDPIYEFYKNNNSRIKPYLLTIISLIITVSSIILIIFLQYDNYYSLINGNFTIAGQNQNEGLCFEKDNYINIISTPIAIFLVIFYLFIFKRRSFLVNKFKYRNFGLPMIVSAWNKENRLFSSFIYGLIALNVFEILNNTLQGKSNSSKLYSFEDPTGLLTLVIKIIEIILIGLSKYLYF
jgi:hypothetical protein